MDLSFILSSPCASCRPFRLSPFASRSPPRLRNLQDLHRKHRCCIRGRRVVFLKSAASFPGELFQPSSVTGVPSIFGGRKEFSGQQALIDALSPPVRTASSIIVAAAAIAAGYGLALRLAGSRVVASGGATALGAACIAGLYAFNSSAPEVAAISLHNLVAGCDDPASLKKEDVDSIITKYGVSKQDEALKDELCDIYDKFVSSILPPGGENLKGNEAEAIIKFKEALGIDDPDAAFVHMEIGRRILRERMETGVMEADVEQHRAFQRLIYISTLVFGDASKFLLPWKRVFRITDAQVDIAIWDNAQGFYALKLKSLAKDIDAKQLTDLRMAQLRYRLGDEIAAEMFIEHSRKIVEENVSSVLDVLKSRTREKAQVVVELEKVLAFNNLLVSLSRHPQSSQFAPGVGPVSLVGGEYDCDRKMDNLKLLYRVYAAECFSKACVDEEKLLALNQLRNIFGLGKFEAESLILDVTSKVYRRRLSQAFSGGELESASSKAAFLHDLCDKLHFDPHKASKIHEDIYRQKLQKNITTGVLSEADFASLQRLRVLLCIPNEAVDAAHADICGHLFDKVVRDAISSGIEGYDADARASVRKTSHGLRLTPKAAMSIASKHVRKLFLNYVQRARGTEDRKEAAKELKMMVVFNTLVVTELVSDIKGDPAVALTELVDDVEQHPMQDEEEDEWKSLETLVKTRSSKGHEGKLGHAGQMEITLKDDLPERDRMDLYKSFLLFCMSGDVIAAPFETQIIAKEDNSEFFTLNQLGGILGLTDNEVVNVHRNLAEQAFLKDAEVILADGQLTMAKMEELDEAQKNAGLHSKYAQKAIKGIITTKVATAIETSVNQGRIGILQVRELKEANVDLDGIVSERLREMIFKKTVEEIFSSGTGVFDDEEVYEKIPAELTLDPMKAKCVVHELAKNKLSNSLVQAIALLRRRNREGMAAAINDMLACDKAVPSQQPLLWSSPEELSVLYCVYLKEDPAPENCSRLQHLLGLSDDTAALLRNTAVVRETLLLEDEEEEEFVF